MSNLSPGRLSNQAFSIGSASSADDITRCNTGRSDALRPLLSSSSEEETPLTMPVPGSQQSSIIDDQHQLVVDVFGINEVDSLWRQSSRFARYEEDCEGFDNHFGKPHVPTIHLSVYHALQKVVSKSVLIKNLEYTSFPDFCISLEKLITDPDVQNLGRTLVSLLEKRVASLEKTKPINKVHSSSTQSLGHSPSLTGSAGSGSRLPRSLLSAPNNLASLALGPQKKLPTAVSGLRFKGSFLGPQHQPSHPLEPIIWDETNELSMLITGVVPDIKVCRLVMVHFTNTIEMPEVFPSLNNIRHLSFLIGPQLEDMEYLDMGRALATVVSNPTFSEVFTKLKSPESINRAIERFLSETVVIAPGRIDNKNLVAGDLIRKIVNMKADKLAQPNSPQHGHVHPTDLDVEKNAPKSVDKEEEQPGCWFFSGAYADVKKRLPYYWNDFASGFTLSLPATVLYMFCVTVVPTLTFGAILSYGTNGILAVKECLIAQAICGGIWSFLSCQPLLIMSPTGPFLVFEKALFQFTESYHLDFLEVRLYTGFFLLILCFFTTAFNLARLIRYVTIYTEDIFCALISLIFFYEVFEFLEHQLHHHPIRNIGYYLNNSMNGTETAIHELSHPNTFLLELIMVVASIAIFHYLRQLSRSTFLGRTIRNFCGNFGGSFAVLVVTVVYHYCFRNVDVSLVDIPEKYGNARDYGLFVIPNHLPTPFTLFVSMCAAPLLFVLLFVETEIPQQMALREFRKLKKGGGLHWDLIIAGICTFVCSFSGLPWQCPAAVQSLAHITVLTVYKKSAPGEPSRVSHVNEQRVTGSFTYVCLGIFSIAGHFIEMPSAAIFGVFFYLGIRNLNGNQLLMRIKMFFLPSKYRGNHKFLDIAPFTVIGIYTIIQTAVVILMFIAKSTQIGGLFFPLMLVACTIFVAKFLPLIFTKELLEALDGEDIEEEEVDNDNEENPVDFYYNTRIPV